MNQVKVYPMSIWLQRFTWPNHRPWLMTILAEDYALGISYAFEYFKRY